VLTELRGVRLLSISRLTEIVVTGVSSERLVSKTLLLLQDEVLVLRVNSVARRSESRSVVSERRGTETVVVVSESRSIDRGVSISVRRLVIRVRSELASVRVMFVGMRLSVMRLMRGVEISRGHGRGYRDTSISSLVVVG